MNELIEIREFCKTLNMTKAMFTAVEPDGSEGVYFYLEVSPTEYQFWREGDMPTNFEDEEFVYETKF